MNAQTAAREIWSRLGDDSVAHCLPSAWIEELIQQAIDEAVKEERARYKALALTWRKQKAHTYASENADEYRQYDAGLAKCARDLESLTGGSP